MAYHRHDDELLLRRTAANAHRLNSGTSSSLFAHVIYPVGMCAV